MLHSFLTTNRALLIERCRAMAAAREPPDRDALQIEQGIPLFLDQLIETLLLDQTGESARSRLLSGVSGGGSSSEIADTATLRSRALLEKGFTIELVVREYGDVCQAVTNLAFETQAPIAVEEFRTLNRCLDNAIAGGGDNELTFFPVTIDRRRLLEYVDELRAEVALLTTGPVELD